jgi:cytochrome c-type biogenesis protein CcmE
MIFSKSTKTRLKIFSLIVIAASIILFFIYNNLQKNVVYFYAPQDIKNLTDTPSNKIRLGGLVKEGSLKKNNNTYVFIIS